MGTLIRTINSYKYYRRADKYFYKMLRYPVIFLLLSLALISNLEPIQGATHTEELSCAGRCDEEYVAGKSCYCNDKCVEFDDCCDDVDQECEQSCAGRCDEEYVRGKSCYCNDKCVEYDDCCDDVDQECN